MNDSHGKTAARWLMVVFLGLLTLSGGCRSRKAAADAPAGSASAAEAPASAVSASFRPIKLMTVNGRIAVPENYSGAYRLEKPADFNPLFAGFVTNGLARHGLKAAAPGEMANYIVKLQYTRVQQGRRGRISGAFTVSIHRNDAENTLLWSATAQFSHHPKFRTEEFLPSLIAGTLNFFNQEIHRSVSFREIARFYQATVI